MTIKTVELSANYKIVPYLQPMYNLPIEGPDKWEPEIIFLGRIVSDSVDNFILRLVSLENGNVEIRATIPLKTEEIAKQLNGTQKTFICIECRKEQAAEKLYEAQQKIWTGFLELQGPEKEEFVCYFSQIVSDYFGK